MGRITALRVPCECSLHDFHINRRSARDAGFDGIELVVSCTELDDEVDQGSAPVEVALRNEQERSPVLALSTVLTDVRVEAAVSQVRDLLGVATSLEARCLNLALPPLTGSGHRAERAGFDRYQDALNYAYHLLRGVRHDSESSGVAMALQAATEGSLLSPVEFRELLDAVNSWSVGACVDTARIARVGNPADWLVTLGARVQAVRVWINDEKFREAGSPATCESPVVGLARALDKIAYDRVVIAAGDIEPAALRRKLDRLLGT